METFNCIRSLISHRAQDSQCCWSFSAWTKLKLKTPHLKVFYYGRGSSNCGEYILYKDPFYSTDIRTTLYWPYLSKISKAFVTMVGIISGIFPANSADAFTNCEPLCTMSVLAPYKEKGARFFTTNLLTLDQSNVLGILIICQNSLTNVTSFLDLPTHFMGHVAGRMSFGLQPHSLYRFIIEVHSLEVLQNKSYKIPVSPTISITGLLNRLDPPNGDFYYNLYDTNTCIYTNNFTILKARYVY